ncbi:hypothetical protein PENSPDRAFT_658601 [Peniophora sp. CONT]|nr:hypothetical protein PENSPDRAFT_658601 [Peniophora sp. CONT]
MADLEPVNPVVSLTAPITSPNSSPDLNLPAEILLLIFEYAQASWFPRKVPESQLHCELLYGKYELGWMGITHVCRLWRQLAENSPSLWKVQKCLDTPPAMSSEVLARSQNTPLELHIHENINVYGGFVPDILRPWTSDAIARRIEKLVYTALGNDCVGLSAIMSRNLPSLQELEVVGIGSRITPIVDGKLNEHIQTSALSHLTLYALFPTWSSSLFSRSLTHMSLGCRPWTLTHDRHTTLPSSSRFCRPLRSLPKLQRLDLYNFFPLSWSSERDGVLETSDEYYLFTLQYLRVIINCDQFLASADYTSFWQHFIIPPSTTLIVQVDVTHGYHFRDEMITPLVKDKANGWPAQELYLSMQKIHAYHVDSPRSRWTQQQTETFKLDGPRVAKNWALDNVHGSRYLHSSKDIHINAARLVHESLNALTIAPSLMDRWTTTQGWIDEFAHARAVRRLTISLVNALPLLQTLVRDTYGEFVLFPALEAIVVHEECAPEDAEGHRYLALKMWLLHAVRTRKRSQKPIREMLVSRKLTGLDVWEDMANETEVSFF